MKGRSLVGSRKKSRMNSSSKPDRGCVCAEKHLMSGFHVQSSPTYLKRFVMFDQSGGKGRMFFHPALAQELFDAAQECETTGPVKGSNFKLLAYKQIVEGAVSSLQTVQASRKQDKSDGQRQIGNPLLPEALTSSQKPRVFETIAKAGTTLAFDDEAPAQQCMASNTLVCEEKAKVPAIAPSTESLRDCTDLVGIFASSSHLSSLKKSDVAAASGSMRENTEDLDALLNSEDDEDDEDEDVQSTGHSPDESSFKEYSFGEDVDEEVEQPPNKRRKIEGSYLKEPMVGNMRAGEESKDKVDFLSMHGGTQSCRRQKIKSTVKALRRIIPGGALLDAALVLDETITYVKALRDRVNQLEATRLKVQHHS